MILKKTFLLVGCVLSVAMNCFAQKPNKQWFFSPNWNLYLPINASKKGTYPIVGYDNESSPKILIGGYGIGVSVIKQAKSPLSWKGQVNLSRYVYWDEPFLATNPFGTPVGSFTSSSTNYYMGFTGTVHYSFGQKFSIGTGMGGQLLFASLSRLPQFDNNNSRIKDLISVNQYYRTFQPIIPLEASLKFKTFLFNLRYEYALLNHFKGDLAKVKLEKYGILCIEIGFKLN